jgi:hypothetical protein
MAEAKLAMGIWDNSLLAGLCRREVADHLQLSTILLTALFTFKFFNLLDIYYSFIAPMFYWSTTFSNFRKELWLQKFSIKEHLY